MAISAVLFDFDGVIVSSLAAHIKAWEVAYAEVCGKDLSDDQKHAIIGRSTLAIADFLARPVAANLITPLADRKKAVLEAIEDTILALPGVEDTFKHLQKKQIPFGIASNAPRYFVKKTLTKLGLSVPVALGYEDAPRPKPAPDLYLTCAKALGVRAVEHPNCFVFEDSTHGLQAAVSAGMIPVGVMTQHSAEILTKAGAKRVCFDVGEALKQGWFD